MYIFKLKTENLKLKPPAAGLRPAFTLVELLIVVSILGILAAIVLPEFQGHVQQSKETAAKANLAVLRGAIERYAADHNGVPPGYLNNDSSLIPNQNVLKSQLVGSDLYLAAIPKNPFNDKNSVYVLSNGVAEMVANPLLTTVHGWIYHPKTKALRLNWPGTDSAGTDYFDY